MALLKMCSLGLKVVANTLLITLEIHYFCRPRKAKDKPGEIKNQLSGSDRLTENASKQ